MRRLGIFILFVVSVAVITPARSQAPAATAPQGSTPVRIDVSVTDSATSTIKQLVDAGADIGSDGDSDSLATVFLFYRGAYQRDYGSSCALLSRGAVRGLLREQSAALGTKTCRSAVAAFSPFAGDVVMADVTETEDDGKLVSGGAVIHAPGRSSVRLALKPTKSGWRITGFGHR